jgi:hypothetical protein
VILVVVALALGGLALRAGGLDWQLPYQLDPDEPVLFLSAAQIRATGKQTLKPGYPPLYMLELAAQQAVTESVSGGPPLQRQQFYLGRLLSSLNAVLLVAIAYQCGRLLAGPTAGALAALFMAVEPASAELGRLIRADTLAWLLSLAALALAFRAANRPSRAGDRTLAGAFFLGALAVLAKYSMLPVLAAPAIVLLRRLVPNALARAGLLAAGALLAVAGLVILRTSETIQTELLARFQLARLVNSNYDFAEQVGANALTLRQSLGDLPLLLAGAGLGLLWLNARHAPALRVRAGAITASAVLALAIYTQAVARYKDMYFLILVIGLLWGVGLARGAAFALDRIRRSAVSSRRLSPNLSGVGALAIGLLLAVPWLRADTAALGGLERPDTRIATAEWLRLNVPQGARIACEYDCVELQGGYGGFPGPQPFHTEVVRAAAERSPDDYRAAGIEYVIADDRAAGYFSAGPEAALPPGLQVLARFEAGEGTGPRRAILAVPPLQQHALYRWLGDAIAFRGFDLSPAAAAPGGELALTLYWMSARTTPADLIVFVHLAADADSPPAVGVDGPPLGGAQPTWRWAGDMQFWADPRTIPIPLDAAPGEYQLRVGMYDRDTGERRPDRSPQGGDLGTAITLETITVLGEAEP